ncbi:MAG TPA: TonB-dependent receptor, partial [Flavobacterium sp.]|nr:TonB-dependent receptor [Flavobacterium sp.]
MKLRLFILTLFISTLSFAQNKGTISGVITDKDANNETLPFANVNVKGTKINTTTDIEGKYSINLAPGSYVVQYTFVGYEPKEVPVKVTEGAKLIINQALSSGAFALSDVVVKATVNRQKETALLLEQKNAVEIKQAIGAQELSRKGVSDVASAVTKVSGITKQEGSGSVFVRGLGDRYNVTTLNGLPLPSNNPSNKNILLDIFSTDIVESIGISKTFESQNYADFSGANVDIVSKKMSGNPFVELGLGLGANSNVVKLDHFYLQDGPSYLGFKKISAPSNPLLPYNFTTSWDRQERKYNLNNNFSLSGGKKFNIGESGSIGTFITASFDNDNKYNEGVYRTNITAQGLANSDFYRKSYKY